MGGRGAPRRPGGRTTRTARRSSGASRGRSSTGWSAPTASPAGCGSARGRGSRTAAGSWTGSSADVTERRRSADELIAAQARLTHLAYHDPLTDLPNRLLFQEHLEQAIARARRGKQAVAVLFVDLDDFKLVNDSHGHTAGDELLRVVADRLRDAVRATDVVARLGGDEFLVLVADIDLEGAARRPSASPRTSARP